MTRTEIRDLVVKAAINTEELTSVIDIICKEIGDAYNKGFNQGKYDPNFDNCEDDDDDDDDVVCGNCDGYGYTVDENGRRKEHCKECE